MLSRTRFNITAKIYRVLNSIVSKETAVDNSA